MKLEGLLLKRAAANRDIEAILQIFCDHLALLKSMGPRPWRICESYHVLPSDMRLETPAGSFHYISGRFRVGGHISDYRIVYHPHFYLDAL